jgi:hypothetical protein
MQLDASEVVVRGEECRRRKGRGIGLASADAARVAMIRPNQRLRSPRYVSSDAGRPRITLQSLQVMMQGNEIEARVDSTVVAESQLRVVPL